jgi:hypothetical protein
VVVGEEVTMPLNFKALGGTLLTIAAVVMAAPLLAQQNPPAAGPDAPPDTGTPPPSGLALQLPFLKVSESMGNHDSKIVDAGSVD